MAKDPESSMISERVVANGGKLSLQTQDLVREMGYDELSETTGAEIIVRLAARDLVIDSDLARDLKVAEVSIEKTGFRVSGQRATPEPHRAAPKNSTKNLIENPTKDLIAALALGFGMVGGTAALGVPRIAYYVPLGFGVAGLALTLVAVTERGRTPWWLVVAALVSAAGFVSGVIGFDEYQQISDDLERSSEQLENLTTP